MPFAGPDSGMIQAHDGGSEDTRSRGRAGLVVGSLAVVVLLIAAVVAPLRGRGSPTTPHSISSFRTLTKSRFPRTPNEPSRHRWGRLETSLEAGTPATTWCAGASGAACRMRS